MAIHPCPVPISERMLDRSDCDARGHCWWFMQSDVHPIPTWAYSEYRMFQGKGTFYQTHWLPAAAIPIPLTISP